LLVNPGYNIFSSKVTNLFWSNPRLDRHYPAHTRVNSSSFKQVQYKLSQIVSFLP